MNIDRAKEIYTEDLNDRVNGEPANTVEEIETAALEMLYDCEPEQFKHFLGLHSWDGSETIQDIANHYFYEQAELALRDGY